MKLLMKRFGSILWGLLIFLVTSTIVQAQELEDRVDRLLQSQVSVNGPGISLLIVKEGKPIYQKAFGNANLELNVPLTTESVFQIGSMTKQFTAIAILMLEEEGKLDLSAPLTQYIPNYPQGDLITMHHLLTHTSGIKDFTKMKTLRDIAQKDLSPKDLVDFFKNEPMDFAPGSEFRYNNSGYALLGYLIELVSGVTYEAFIEQRIFEKIGMKDSRYANEREIVQNRAYGYQEREGYVNKMRISLNIPYASGALMSTVNDLWLWQQALNQGLLVNKASLEKAFTPKTLNSGADITYGYGWHIKELEESPSREHGGSIFGFKSMAVYLPEQDIYVVGLTNCDCISPTQLVRDIAALTLEESRAHP